MESESTTVSLKSTISHPDIEPISETEIFNIEIVYAVESEQITIRNPNSTVLSDHEVLVNINNKGGINDDFDNIRFVNESNDKLPHWVEYVSGDSADIWVKVDNMDADSNTSIELQVNDNFEDEESGSDTFRYFDDFSEDTSSDWTFQKLLYDRGSGNRFIWEPNNNRVITDTSNSDWYSTYDLTEDDETLESDGFVAEISTRTDDDDGMGVAFSPEGDTEYELYATMISNDYEGADNNNYESLVGWTDTEYNGTGTTATEIIDYGQIVGGSTGSSINSYKTVTMRYDGNNLIESAFDREIQSDNYTESGIELDKIGLVSAANDPEAYYDWFIVRSYAENQPYRTN